MSKAREQHAEWLRLIEVNGPFLAEPILRWHSPGLPGLDGEKNYILDWNITYSAMKSTIRV